LSIWKKGNKLQNSRGILDPGVQLIKMGMYEHPHYVLICF
jgi:hypothetical protein